MIEAKKKYFHKRYQGEMYTITYDKDLDTEHEITVPLRHTVRDSHLVQPHAVKNMAEIETMMLGQEFTEIVYEWEIMEVRVSSLMTMSRGSALQYIVKNRVGKNIEILDQMWNEENQAFYMVVEHIKTTEEEE